MKIAKLHVKLLNNVSLVGFCEAMLVHNIFTYPDFRRFEFKAEGDL